MWILPKQLISAFVPDTAALKIIMNKCILIAAAVIIDCLRITE